MNERKFTQGLQKRGHAAKIRATVSQAMRQSVIGSRPPPVDPLDYETYIIKNKVVLHNDPQREMLNFPYDDVEIPPPVRRKKQHTLCSTVPKSALTEDAKSLLVRECIKTYTSGCHIVHFKYSAYSGSYQQLPNCKKRQPLPEQIFEIDADTEDKDEDTFQNRSTVCSITKEGWLYKGPDGNKDMVISFTRQYKRRYFCLKQQTDYSYILEFYKAEKKSEAKGAIFLDLAENVIKNPKKGKFCFELQMQDRPSYLLAAETETEQDDWMSALKMVINASETSSQASVDRSRTDDECLTPTKQNVNNISLEHSMHPELVKYSRETDSSLSKARQDGRQNLFAIYPDMNKCLLELEEDDVNYSQQEIDIFPKNYGDQFMLRLLNFSLKLQANLDGDDLVDMENLHNPEPFFISFALYDAKEGRKISEDFCIDPNQPDVQKMIPSEVLHASDRLHTVEGKNTSPELYDFSKRWLHLQDRRGIFSITGRHPEIYLFAKIDKVLQGGISHCTDPYIKATDLKLGTKVHRQMKMFCAQIGHYRMPFAWAAKSVFFSPPGEAILPLYRQESSKMSEEEIIKHLQDMKRPEKQSKWQVIPGVLKIQLEPVIEKPSNCLTSSLVPLIPFPQPPSEPLCIEVEEFLADTAELSTPFGYYQNILYVYPQNLKFDGQKTFAKARNIACCIELRDSDSDGAVPLQRIYGRPWMSVFTTVASTPVLHHNTYPEFNEEVKISLPTRIHEKHHLLFRFYHVSCESSKTSPRNSTTSSKRKDNLEQAVGCAWLPLLKGGKLLVEKPDPLPVAASLPPGYLSHENLGMGKMIGPEIKWVDGKKEIFRVHLRLKSTIYTKDQHLHNFFVHCEKMESNFTPSVEADTTNKLKPENGGNSGMPDVQAQLNAVKSLHAVDVSTFVHFLPTILNQLFRLITMTNIEEVAVNAARVLTHIVSVVHKAGKTEVLQTYVKFVFKTIPTPKASKTKTVHEELAKNLTAILRPVNADQLVVTRFLRHSWWFFEILIKSMTQYLTETERIKMPRNERFSSDYQYRIQNLIQTIYPHLLQTQQETLYETKIANRSLASFVKNLFTLIDRGFVFRIISGYMGNFTTGDPKVLHQYKFEFLRIVCSHEHYIPLCLPLMRRGLIKNYKDIQLEDLKHDYTLSEEYRKNHYLSGLLLQELKLALYEAREVHRCAITVIKNLIAKHAFDDRYSSKGQQGRIAALYLPLIPILLDCKNRLIDNADTTRPSTSSVSQLELSGVSSDNLMQTTHHKSCLALDQTKRDSAVLDAIAGKGGIQSISSLNINDPKSLEVSLMQGDNKMKSGTHSRTHSMGGQANCSSYIRYDKLDSTEVKDLLVCFLYILKNLPEDILLGWFNNSSEYDIIDMFSLLELCLHQFKYVGRKKIFTLSMIGDSRKAMTAPPSSRKSFGNGGFGNQRITLSQSQESPQSYYHIPSSSEAGAMLQAMQEANMATEVGLIVLDILSLYSVTFKNQLEHKDGDNSLMRKVFDLYLSFLQNSQSETLQKHIFAAWRAFIRKFQSVLFKGNASLCGELCYEILRCCNSRLNSTRKEACALLYLLMRSNFEFSKKMSFTRVHLQVIISVSQLIGDVVGLSNFHFQQSLVMINNYANSDKAMQKTKFPNEVKDLTKRIRTVLMATAQLKEHENDPEMLVDLQYCLAKSYASTPELRKTWLESMAKTHIRTGDYSEAAHCYIHIAALVAEYLKRRGSYPDGCSAFHIISPNIQAEESSIKDDSGMQDVHYTKDTLIELLEQACTATEQAERYEMLGIIYKLIIPIYEYARDFEKLAYSYHNLCESCKKVVSVMHSGRRLLGKYYRVTFFGQAQFDDEHGKEYIYKEPKVTNLSEICERLCKLYSDKFGKENVKLIKDSKKVNCSDLDPKLAHIQVTYVTPYFDKQELKERLTDFERNNNIRFFMFETPFTKEGCPRGIIDKQYKLRTILTTSHYFPYVKKRIEVVDHMEQELSPIEVAIDEMQIKVAELTEVVHAVPSDVIKLQLKLQGSVNAQVNAGPLAYADAFLNRERVSNYLGTKVIALKDVFRQFIQICSEALELNGTLIETEQKDYHEAMKAGFKEICDKLKEIVGDDKFISGKGRDGTPNRYSVPIMNLLSSTSGASTV